jgi:hypothetical protein
MSVDPVAELRRHGLTQSQRRTESGPRVSAGCGDPALRVAAGSRVPLAWLPLCRTGYSRVTPGGGRDALRAGTAEFCVWFTALLRHPALPGAAGRGADTASPRLTQGVLCRRLPSSSIAGRGSPVVTTSRSVAFGFAERCYRRPDSGCPRMARPNYEPRPPGFPTAGCSASPTAVAPRSLGRGKSGDHHHPEVKGFMRGGAAVAAMVRALEVWSREAA